MRTGDRSDVDTGLLTKYVEIGRISFDLLIYLYSPLTSMNFLVHLHVVFEPAAVHLFVYPEWLVNPSLALRNMRLFLQIKAV